MNKHKNYNPSHYIAGSEAVVFFSQFYSYDLYDRPKENQKMI